ncbi:hypothetical protein [Kitasatospora viridis]|uniref:hypothetical protein n=1 Tax=Kitasatospora viridis TaxID=281105 RepID=UPI0011AAD9F0|nr:hypothetical protein [Kitasatospora viridis]
MTRLPYRYDPETGIATCRRCSVSGFDRSHTQAAAWYAVHQQDCKTPEDQPPGTVLEFRKKRA